MSKFIVKATAIQVGNGQHCSILFVIPVIFIIHQLYFKMFTLISEIHCHVDLVFDIKNLFEIEAELNTRKSQITFLNWPIPIFPLKGQN